MGGVDVPGIDRASGSERIFSLEEYASFGISHTVGYESRGQIFAHFEHFTNEVIEAGYDIRRSHVERDKAYLDAVDSQGSIAVFITPNARDPSRIIDVLQYKAH